MIFLCLFCRRSWWKSYLNGGFDSGLLFWATRYIVLGGRSTHSLAAHAWQSNFRFPHFPGSMKLYAVRSNSELLDAAINSRSHGWVSVRQQLRMLMSAHKLHCCSILRLRNDLYCVEWGVKLYSLTYLLFYSLTAFPARRVNWQKTTLSSWLRLTPSLPFDNI